MKKSRIVIAVLIGILIGGGLLLCQYLFCLHNWNYEYKVHLFDTFSDYLFSEFRKMIPLSLFFAFLPVGLQILNYFMQQPSDAEKNE
jgi:hypothetical protein